MNILKIKNQKSGGTLALIEKDSYLSVSQSVSEKAKIIRGDPPKIDLKKKGEPPKKQQRSIYFKGQLSRASHLDKNMELLKCLIVLYEQFINRKQKSGGTHAFFEKDRLVSQSVNAKLVKGHNCSKGRGSPQKTLILKCFYLSYVTSKSAKNILL